MKHKRPVQLLASLLAIGHRFKTSSSFLVGVGIAVTVFGLLPGGNFFTEIPTLRGNIRIPLPHWLGRLGFVGAGALLIYWGLTHGRV